MATTTPNFGWAVPTSTDLVKDGAVAIETLGDSIDASLVDLKGGTTNQVLAKNSNTDMDFKWVADASGIPATIIDAKGDLIAGTAADTAARLAVGANDTVLTADSTAATGLKWAAPASGGGMTLLSTTSLTGASTTISSINQTYTDLRVIVYGWTGDFNNVRNFLRLNGISTSTYRCVFSSSYQTANYVFSPTSAVLTNNVNDAVATSTYVFTIPNYTNTSITKVVQYYGFNYDNNTPSFESFNASASTEITSAISSLVFSRGSGNLTGGTVLVYGVK